MESPSAYQAQPWICPPNVLRFNHFADTAARGFSFHCLWKHQCGVQRNGCLYESYPAFSDNHVIIALFCWLIHLATLQADLFLLQEEETADLSEP